MQVLLRFTRERLILPNEQFALINGLTYISERSQLPFVDDVNRAIRSLRIPGDHSLRNVYKSKPTNRLSGLCYVSETDTLLVSESDLSDGVWSEWLVALQLQPEMNEWNESHRVKTEWKADIICALSGARVLCGTLLTNEGLNRMALYQIENGRHIARVGRIPVDQNFRWFEASHSAVTLVAIFYGYSILLHQLNGCELLELSCIKLEINAAESRLLWVDDKLLVHDYIVSPSNPVIELEMEESELIHSRQLVLPHDFDSVRIKSWCSIEDKLAIWDDLSKELIIYSTRTLETVDSAYSAAGSQPTLDSWLHSSSSSFGGI